MPIPNLSTLALSRSRALSRSVVLSLTVSVSLSVSASYLMQAPSLSIWNGFCITQQKPWILHKANATRSLCLSSPHPRAASQEKESAVSSSIVSSVQAKITQVFALDFPSPQYLPCLPFDRGAATQQPELLSVAAMHDDTAPPLRCLHAIFTRVHTHAHTHLHEWYLMEFCRFLGPVSLVIEILNLIGLI